MNSVRRWLAGAAWPVRMTECANGARHGIAALAVVLGIVASDGRAQSPTPEVMERSKKATVLVFTAASERSQGDKPLGSGTGFFVNSTGLCMSNNHVVDPGHKKSEQERFKVVYQMGRLTWTVVTDSGTPEEKTWKADVLYQNEQADMAVLQVKNEDGSFLETPNNYMRLRPTHEVELQTKAWCLGFPGGDSQASARDKHPLVSISSGNIVEFPRSATGRLTGIITDVLANPGNSGGPFIDVEGRVLGITTAVKQTEGRAATSILVPASLTMEMIRRAFERGKIPSGVDINPFIDAFTNRHRIWQLPQKPRASDRDCVTLDTGSKICGAMSDTKITWPSPLGDIEVPTSAMAYVVADGTSAAAFLDGGDRFMVDRDKASVKFTPEGGTPISVKLENVAWIGFRTPAEPPATPKDSAYVIGGDDFHLSLLDVTGDVSFKESSLDATISVPAATIRTIETEEPDRVLFTSSGSRVAGRFNDHTLSAKLAWSGSPIKFSFSQVRAANIRNVDFVKQQEVVEIDLAKSLDTSDSRLVQVAKLLDAHDVAPAGPKIDALVTEETFRALSPEKQEQVQFLRGEYLLRTGKFTDAAEVFGRLKRAKVEDVAWHSRARTAMLERYPDGLFNGAPISQTATFKKASLSLAGEFERDAGQTLDGIEKADPDARGTYMKLLKRSEDAEEKLLIANRLTSGMTDESVVRLWRVVSRLHGQEIARLMRERAESAEGRGNQGRGGRPPSENQRRQLDQKITQFDRDIESAQEDFVALQVKIESAGFIIDDPDYIAGNGP